MLAMAQATKLFDLSSRLSDAASRPPVLMEREAEALHIEGPRKLVRPRMPENISRNILAPRRLRGAEPLVKHEGHRPPQRANGSIAASHAEALYFQKQMQTQTQMVFVLEDGESIQGVVEWFDRDTIKVRNCTRTLIFKRSVKYLYKAGESDA